MIHDLLHYLNYEFVVSTQLSALVVLSMLLSLWTALLLLLLLTSCSGGPLRLSTRRIRRPASTSTYAACVASATAIVVAVASVRW